MWVHFHGSRPFWHAAHAMENSIVVKLGLRMSSL